MNIDGDNEGVQAHQLAAWMSLIRVSQLLPARLDEALRTEGSNLARYEILAVLSRCPDGVRLTELCERALVSKPRMSVHVGELITAGLVERRPDPTDGRASIVTITAAGIDVFGHWQPGHRALAHELVIDAMSSDELRTLGRLLAKVRSALGDDLELPT